MMQLKDFRVNVIPFTMNTLKYLIPLVLPIFIMCSPPKKDLADVEKKIASVETETTEKANSELFDCEGFWEKIEFPRCKEGAPMVIDRRKDDRCSHIDIKNGTIIIQTYPSNAEALTAYSKKLKGLSLAPQEDHNGQMAEINENNAFGDRSFELKSKLDIPMVCHFQQGVHTVLFTYNRQCCWNSEQLIKIFMAIDEELKGV